MPDRTELHDAIRGAADPLTVMDRIVAQAVLLVPGADGASFEIRRDADTLEYVSAAGTLQDHVGLRLPVQGSLSGTALRTGEIVRTDDARLDERTNREAVERTGLLSMLCVPVQAGAGGGSVLKVSSRQVAAFSDDDVTTLQHLATFLGVIVGAASDIATVTADLLGEVDAKDAEAATGSTLAHFVANVMRPGLLETVESRQRIEEILESGPLDMLVQPIYDLRTRELVSVEALARFPGDRRPDRWFADARAAGLGVELELLAVRSALGLLASIPEHVHLAINVGPETLLGDGLDELLRAAPRDRLTIELTEHQRFTDYGALVQRTATLRDSGVLLSLDDTGSGYSGLTHILNLRPDVVKIDRELTTGIEDDLVRQALTTALVVFAARLEADVVAEGIETSQALDRLVELGVNYGQGYHLGRPMRIDQLVATIAAR
jgi:EAL domain-containing protein (putative c-di-GMP-specific phosphodiesterase class I)